MQRFKRLLVPVDFSADAAEATLVAADLARRFDGSLTLIHVYDPLIYAVPDGFVMVPRAHTEKLLDAFWAQLADYRQRALAAGAPKVHVRLLQGLVAGEIVQHAKEGEFDLVVMGTHGRTGLSHLIMGSVAERVLRLSPCPVLTVKAKTAAAA
jgi:universal stress protein A